MKCEKKVQFNSSSRYEKPVLMLLGEMRNNEKEINGKSKFEKYRCSF